jgi:hypothetical protein
MDDLVSTLQSVGGGNSASSMPKISFAPGEDVENDDKDVNWINQQLARTDLHPVARKALQTERDSIIQSQSPSQGVTNDLMSTLQSIPDSNVAANQPKQSPSMLSKLQPVNPIENIANTYKGLAETGANLVSGVGNTIAGGYKGLYAFGKGLYKGQGLDQSVQNATDVIQNQQAKTYQPQTEAGKLITEYNPLALAGKATTSIGGALGSGEAATIQFISDKLGVPPEIAQRMAAAGGTAMDVGTQFLAPFAVGKGITAANKAAQSARLAKTEMPAEISSNRPALATQQQVEATAPITESPTYAPEGQKLSLPEQQGRADILQRVGVQNVHSAQLQGDEMTGGVLANMARYHEPAGIQVKDNLDQQKADLSNFGSKIVSDTGGSLGMDETVKSNRGNAILAPLEGLQNWYNSNISRFYKESDARAQGQPVGFNSFKDTLNDDSLLTNQDRVLLKPAITAYMKKLGMVDENGNFSGSALQAETVRKFLNDSWSPQNSKFVGALKDSLDDDVTSSAGKDIYQQARAIRTLRARTLDDPKGIAKILDSSGPDEINRKVEIPKIADTITSMAPNQLSHIIDTLKNVPDELQPQAQTAISEIKAHMANKLLEAGNSTQGQWNAGAVTKVIKDNKEKMNRLFSPDELSNINDLNDAGHILHLNTSYPGASAQAANALKQGLMSKMIQGTSAVAGGKFGPIGSFVGNVVGSKLATDMAEKSALKKVQKEFKAP